MNVLILNRRFFGWCDDVCTYYATVPPELHRVAYVVDAGGARGLSSQDREGAAAIYQIPSLDDKNAVLAAAEVAARQMGSIDRVVSLHEDDMLTAAELRVRHGAVGHRPARILPFRDKLLMKDRLHRVGIEVPRFSEATNAAALAAELGFPLVLKPRQGSASRGIHTPADAKELAAALLAIGDALPDYEAEEYVVGPILHLDGLMQDGSVLVFQPFRYVGSCLEFARGSPIGVVMVDDAALATELRDFSARVCLALDWTDGPFHLEVILRNGQTPVFLEIGARVGGAFVPNTVMRAQSYSLVDETIRRELDPDYRSPRASAPSTRVYGWLLFPDPPSVPVRVTNSMSLANWLPGIYREMVPQVGDVLDGKGGYIRTAGTFLLDGASGRELDLVIATAIAEYHITWEKI